MKNMEEKHDTSRNIIIAILVIAIIAVLGYFIYTSTLDNEEEAIPNEVEDTVPDVNDNTFDEIGAYSVWKHMVMKKLLELLNLF